MDRKKYEWERNYYGNRMMDYLTKIRNVINGIESVQDIVRDFYKMDVVWEQIAKDYAIFKYLEELECEFLKEEQNDD